MSRIEEGAHVLTKEDGQRNVDCLRDFQDESEFLSFLQLMCYLIGVGKNALVFRLEDQPDAHFPTESIIRIEVINVISVEWSRELMTQAKEWAPHFSTKIEMVEKNLDKRVSDLQLSAKRLKEIAAHEVRKRIAAHNAAFRRNPASCVPINSYVSFKGKHLAILMKFLDGVELRNTCYEQVLLPHEVLVDTDAENILVDIRNVSPSINRHIIDISDFVPSV